MCRRVRVLGMQPLNERRLLYYCFPFRDKIMFATLVLLDSVSSEIEEPGLLRDIRRRGEGRLEMREGPFKP